MAGRCHRAAHTGSCGCSCSLACCSSTFPPSIAGVRLFRDGLFVRRSRQSPDIRAVRRCSSSCLLACLLPGISNGGEISSRAVRMLECPPSALMPAHPPGRSKI